MGKSEAVIHRYVQCCIQFYMLFIIQAVMLCFFASAETCADSGLHALLFDSDNISGRSTDV